MHEQDQEHHVLIVNDEKGRHAIALDAATYSLGRDATNAIVLNSATVSRQHAILLRVPVPHTNRYRYRLVDGNAKGKPSANGVFANGQRCSSHELANGDVISFGEKVSASYQVVAMEEAAFINYIGSAGFQSIKSEAVNPKATVVGLDLKEELAHIDLPEPQDPRSTMTAHETKSTAPSFSWLWIGGGVIIVIGIAAAGWIWASGRSPNEASPTKPTSVLPSLSAS
jgi:pSer/pThr/pTyr-binding forkhead associated (FHA) protein